MTTSRAQQPAAVPGIGRYHLIAELARGGMGHVYLAASQGPGGFNKLHALKELKAGLCDDDAYVTMFLEEARLAARLIHPNIVQTNEVGSEDGRHFMVMEFLDGRSLHRIGKRLGARLTIGARLRVIAEALLGLHYVHELRGFDGEELGIVHRDISPLNVFVTFNGEAKVLDFGIAKTANSTLDTQNGILKGRIAYMSPEQANGAKVDRRSDIYAAGVMIWEAAAGRRLWPQMSEVQILTRVLRDGPPSLRSVQPHAPDELNRICARAMAYRPEDRYVSAADLLGDLELYLARADGPMTMRDIGALVGQAYGDERRKMDGLIEETLARVLRRTSSGVMPTFRMQLGVKPTDPNVLVDGSAVAALSVATPSNSFGPDSRSQSQSVPATAASLTPKFAAASAPSASKRVTLPTLTAGAFLLGILLLGAVWHQRGPQARATAPAIAVGESPPVVFESVREAPRKAHVVVTASPKLAQLYLDETVVANPYVADHVRDATPHRLRVEAQGYQSATRTLAFGDDVDLEITLEAARSVPGARHAGRQTSAPPSAPPNPSPNCQPPYVVDLDTGKRHWRLECL